MDGVVQCGLCGPIAVGAVLFMCEADSKYVVVRVKWLDATVLPLYLCFLFVTRRF